MNQSHDIWIEVSGKRYSAEALKMGQVSNSSNEIENAVFSFCREWLSDVDSFRLYTSGSTGTPKEIILPRSSMVSSALGTEHAVGLRQEYTALLCLDPRYVAGRMMLVRSFVTGMNVIVVEPVANPFSSLAQDTAIDFTAIVPYQLQSILADPASKQRFNSLQSVLIGGAALDATTKDQIKSLTPAIYATYGMTETISHVALQKVNPPDEQDYFQVLPGVNIAADERGCLVISANYLGSEKIITNDLVEILEPYKFRWLGRADNVINSGGVKVIPEKVEMVIAKVFATMSIGNRFFIAGLEDAQLGNKVVLFVEGELGIEKSLVLINMKEELSRFETPKEIIEVLKFVETNTQKVNRKETKELWAARTQGH